MLEYIVSLQNSDDKHKICFSTSSEKSETVRVIIHNQYFNTTEYDGVLTIPPGGYCWIYSHGVSSNRYINFIDVNTNQSVGLYNLPGQIDYTKEFPYSHYIKKLIPKLSHENVRDLEYILNEIVFHKVYNNEFIFVEENDVVVDIGFNCGLFSLDSLSHRPKKIIGIEPNKRLIDNFLECIDSDKIELHNIAISKENKLINFYENDFFGRSTILDEINKNEFKQPILVQSVNFNDFVKSNGIKSIDFLKIDCEGAEYEIINSIETEYLKNNIRKLAIEFHNEINHPNVINLFNRLNECGFEIKKDYGGDGWVTGMLYARK